jgi:uncharacterized protein
MVSLLVIFFFAITGITLNHREWAMSSVQLTDDYSGAFPEGWQAGETIDWLRVVEHLRAEHGVRGSVQDYRADDLEGSVTFRAPGYAADAFFDPLTGDYELSVVRMGFVGVLNELHRGQDAGTAWRWVIDVSGAFLAVLSLTGLGLLLYLRKFRRSALVVMAVGSAGVVVLMLLIT